MLFPWIYYEFELNILGEPVQFNEYGFGKTRPY